MPVKLILKYAPVFIQNLGISLYNSYLYRQRHGGSYKKFRAYFLKIDNLPKEELDKEVSDRLTKFLNYATNNSMWYSKYKHKNLNDFPILNKRDILDNFNLIKTIDDKKGYISLTGGTTGASMKVVYTFKNLQERFALIDHFREQYGYKLGKKVAWFSGKSLVRQKDLNRGICYRDDYLNKIRFFSTFHINKKNFKSYWNSLIEFNPEFIIGFPSSVYEICLFAIANKLNYPYKIKVFFPTAETVLQSHRDIISKVFGCEIIDQYASSEGAPFITQCKNGSLHINSATGVFEVFDENMIPSNEGEILVTSFTTEGTPLIRYRIGDKIKLAPKNFKCKCGSNFPIVLNLEGRTNDFIWSPEYGKVNLGNISNCTKDAKGIICFQLNQNKIDHIEVLLVINNDFSISEKEKFLKALKLRLGNSISIELHIVEDIPKEKSGKFRIVKNNLNQEDLI